MQYCQTFTYPLTSGLACYTSQSSFLDKSKNENERALYDDWWAEQISLYGMKVDYYTHGYRLSAHDFLYGEDPTSQFGTPTELTVLADVSNDSMILSKFGITSTADITVFIHIRVFKEVFGADAEPKSGDLIWLKEYGSDRPGGREGQVYEITERDDEAINATNQLMGHYVWLVKGTRFDFSFESGAKKEAKNDQVYDNSASGLVAGSLQPTSPPKLYTDDATTKGNTIFNYGNEGVQTDVYGDYH